MIVGPDPALAPVMPPTIVPTVQVKLLGTVEVREILGPDPLQVLALVELVTVGAGLTVTVIVYCGPEQVPAVGVTRY